MKTALINGSPRRKNSASAFLLKELSEKLAGCVYGDCTAYEGCSHGCSSV